MAFYGNAQAARERAEIMDTVAELRRTGGQPSAQVSSALRSAQSLRDLAEFYDILTSPERRDTY